MTELSIEKNLFDAECDIEHENSAAKLRVTAMDDGSWKIVSYVNGKVMHTAYTPAFEPFPAELEIEVAYTYTEERTLRHTIQFENAEEYEAYKDDPEQFLSESCYVDWDEPEYQEYSDMTINNIEEM